MISVLGCNLSVTGLNKFFNCCSNSCGCSLLSLYPETIVTVFRRFGLIAKLFQSDHEALRRDKNEWLILLEPLSLYPATIVTVFRRFGLIAKLFQSDHEALRRDNNELSILLELV